MKNTQGNKYTESIDILNLKGHFSPSFDKYEFALFNPSKIIKVEDIYKLVDPSNDQAFKILFNGEYKLNNITGLQRAKSLIESLLYEFKGQKLIKNLQYYPNEIPEVSGKIRKKLRVLDCPLLCEMNGESKYIIDLEMQTYFYDGLDLNALSYGTALYNAYHIPVIIFVLLLKNSYDNLSFEIKSFKRYMNQTEFKPIDDYVYVFCIDLYYILDCINNGVEPDLDGLKISQKGKEWIKLLTIADWMPKCNRGDIIRYPLPKNLSNSEEIISAIKILDSSDNSKLVKNVMKERERNLIIEDIETKTQIKYWISALTKGKILDSSIIPFPEVAPEYLIRECKKYLDKKNCIEFLEKLIMNKIIEKKDIYGQLIDKFYSD